MADRSKARSRTALLVLLLGSLLVVPGSAGAEVELYPAQHRPAEELAPVAAELLAPGGTAFADPGAGVLILKGSPEALRKALEVVRSLDRPLASYRIESVLSSEGELQSLGASAEGWIERGDLRVLRPRGSEVSLSLLSLFDSTRSRFRAEVSVMQGHWAEIWTGTAVTPEIHVLREYEGDEVDTRVFSTTPALSLRSGLSVRPHRYPDGSLDLEIQPVLQRGSRVGVEAAGASTRIRLRPDEIVAVGSVERASDSSGLGTPMAAHRTREQRHTIVLIRARELSAGE